VSFTEVLAGFVQNLFFNFGARSTHIRCLFQDTRPLATFTVVVRSSHRKLRPRRYSVPSAWPARARHAPESLLLFDARVGHVPPFLAVHGVGWGLWWSILCWVVPVTVRVLHAPPSPADSATVSLPAAALDFLCFLCTFSCGSQFVYL
jgi:hypothetical protein